MRAIGTAFECASFDFFSVPVLFKVGMLFFKMTFRVLFYVGLLALLRVALWALLEEGLFALVRLTLFA